MTTYTIRQGDFLAKIARDHGFSDWKTIWEHASNRELREKRKNPNVLLPGDALVIPERETKALDASTETRHRFSLTGPSRLKLVLQFDDPRSGPVANAKCRLEVGGQGFDLVSDGRGRIEHEIPPDAQQGRVVVDEPASPLHQVVIPLRIGHLDPVEEVSGQSARLNNLGYFAGPFQDQSADEAAVSLRSAIEEFQCDHGLAVDGVCGPQTQRALRQAHGC